MLHYLRIETWYSNSAKTVGCWHQLTERVEYHIVHLQETGVILLSTQPLNNMWQLKYKYIYMIVLYRNITPTSGLKT